MSNGCERHRLEQAVGTCGSCRGGYCKQCLVHVFGNKRPALCVPCALWAGGVRPTRPPRHRAPLWQRLLHRQPVPAMATAAPAPVAAAPAGFTAAALRAEFGQERKAVVLERARRHHTGELVALAS